MSDTLVERAGRAMFAKAASYGVFHGDFDKLASDIQALWCDLALAALRAIREPGPAVLAQVEAQINAGNPIEWAWQGGVDAAIAEAEAEKSR